MSIADIEFINMCRDILENGTSTEGQKVRPKWPDGTPAYTIMKFCEINRFDLRKEFPMLTLRKRKVCSMPSRNIMNSLSMMKVRKSSVTVKPAESQP